MSSRIARAHIVVPHIPTTTSATRDSAPTQPFWRVSVNSGRYKDVGRGPIGHAGVKRMTRRKRGSIADAIDCHVGSRIRERRITLGLTWRQLGKMIGLTVPQIHKYECGFNRVSAGKLFEIACALSAPITYFFEDTGQEGPQQITLHERMLLNVVRNVAKIRNEQQREAVSELVRALAST